MATKPEITPSDLPTKIVRGPDGTTVRMKVVQADSPMFAQELQAAFRSNVRRIRDERRKRTGSADFPL